jgi:carboxylate-amine ligase
VLRELPPSLAAHARGETHGLALELATSPHATVARAVADLRGLRAGLVAVLRGLGLRAAVAGTHPTVRAEEVEVSPGARYQYLHTSLRELARREPTFALHVHVAVPDPELAVRALNGLRAHVPVLLALAANSPFMRGSDSGLASARTPVFQAFPRTGVPREFSGYADYVEAIDVLIRCGGIPEPTFVWWDVRLQPRLGTIELRVMDAQTRIRDTAALAALVQCLVRLEALDEPELALAPEVIAENRFLAARDGISAALLDPDRDRCVPAAGRLATLVDACWPHAHALGCERELAMLAHLAGDPGAARQRAIASEPEGIRGLLHALQAEFSPPRPQLAAAA